MNSTSKSLVSAVLVAFAFLLMVVPSTKALVVQPNAIAMSTALESSSLVTKVRGRRKRAHRAKRRGRRPNANRPNRPNRPGANRPNRNKWKKRARRRFWGRVVGGIALGTAIAVTAGRVPPRPSSDLCWTWSNNVRTQGYWYYCVEPY